MILKPNIRRLTNKSTSMFIEELHLISFKGFRDFKLKCSQFTTLTGMNSDGKTSILQAIQLIHDFFRYVFGGHSNTDIKRPNFTNIKWSYNFGDVVRTQIIHRINSGDPDALWLNKKTSAPCKLSLKVSGGMEVKLEIPSYEKYTLDLLINNTSIKNQVNKPEYQKIVEDFFSLFPTFVPPTANLPPIEKFISHKELSQKLDKGLIAECWRSYLYWLCNDGDNRNSNKVVEIVQRYLPNTVLQLPRLTHDNPPQVSIEFEENETVFDISVSGGGLRTISSLAVILHFSKSKCLLLDEPDAHLQSSLQHQVAQMLLDHALENDIQVFVTSHAPDFIAEIPVEYLTWVDRTKEESRTCNEVSQFLSELGTVTKVDAIRNYGADKILFIEGGLDRKVISQFFNCYFQENSQQINPFTDDSVIVAELPNGKGDRNSLASFQKLLLTTFKIDAKIACILDNDYEISEKKSETHSLNTLLMSLKRKEIENYFLDSRVISTAAKKLSEQRSNRTNTKITYPNIEDVEQKLIEILDTSDICNIVKCQVVPAYRNNLSKELDSATKEAKADEWFAQKWDDPDWRIRNCPGKKVFKRLKEWCQKEYSLTLTDRKLIAALNKCPDDIQDIMIQLHNHFYS